MIILAVALGGFYSMLSQSSQSRLITPHLYIKTKMSQAAQQPPELDSLHCMSGGWNECL